MSGTRATIFFDDLFEGSALPELRIPLSRTMIVATAIASRDYQDVHHDPALALARGSEDIFMNILTTNGLVGRFVTDWAGPGAIITDVSIRLGAPNYPGDVMVLSGRVERLSPSGTCAPDDSGVHAGTADGRGQVEVAIRGANSRGDHVTGTVALLLPRRRSREK